MLADWFTEIANNRDAREAAAINAREVRYARAERKGEMLGNGAIRISPAHGLTTRNGRIYARVRIDSDWQHLGIYDNQHSACVGIAAALKCDVMDIPGMTEEFYSVIKSQPVTPKILRTKVTKETLAVKDVTDRFSYNPKTGQLKYRTSVNQMRAGDVVCSNVSARRDFRVAVMGRYYTVPIICWFILYGEWPKRTIEFIDGNWRNCSEQNMRLKPKGKK